MGNFEKELMKPLIFEFLFFQQLLAKSSFSKAKYSKCIVEDAGNVEVSATTGLYTGIRQGCVVNGNIKYWNEFRGIKYGRKPVRFEKPIPKATNNNPQDATKYGSQCVQRRTDGYESPYYVGDEDCLYLNVMKRENPSNTNLLPVFIWIHGGSSKHGNNTGDVWSEDSHQYDGRFLALQENIVFVSINYRVNSFGFLIWKGNKGTSTWNTNINGRCFSWCWSCQFGELIGICRTLYQRNNSTKWRCSRTNYWIHASHRVGR